MLTLDRLANAANFDFPSLKRRAIEPTAIDPTPMDRECFRGASRHLFFIGLV